MKKYYDPVVETMRKKQRLGADLALAYMALISNTDVYSDMLERGATKKEAAWVALGSTAAMFSVDRFAHLGEVFYDDLTAESIIDFNAFTACDSRFLDSSPYRVGYLRRARRNKEREESKLNNSSNSPQMPPGIQLIELPGQQNTTKSIVKRQKNNRSRKVKK